MEAARQQDELAALAAKTPLPQSADMVKPAMPSPVKWRDLKPEELDLLQLVVEGETWGNVLDLSEKDDLETTRALVALKKKDVVRY